MATKKTQKSKFGQVVKGLGITLLVLITLLAVYTVASSVYALVVDVTFVEAFTSFFGVIEVSEEVVEETTTLTTLVASSVA